MQVTDPVCSMQIDSAKAAASETVEGRSYYFCSTSCHNQFRADPDRYVKKDQPREGGGSHRH